MITIKNHETIQTTGLNKTEKLTNWFQSKLQTISFFLLGLFISTIVVGQNTTLTPEPCNQGCTAKDLKLKTAYLVSKDQDGNIIPLQQCLSGNAVTVYLAVELITSTPRKGLSAFTNLMETPVGGGAPTYQVLAECFPETSLATTGDVTRIVFTQALSWICGSAVELKETRISWGTGNTDFCAGSSDDKCGATASKCWKQGPSEVIIVETFPCVGATASNPSNSTKCTGASTSFSSNFTAAANTQVIAVKWQVDKNDGNGYLDINIRTSPYSITTTSLPVSSGTTTLSISNVAGLNGYKYRAHLTSYASSSEQTCSTSTNGATLTVDALSVGGTATAGASPICAGGSTSITLSGFTGSIQKWQYATNGAWTDINSTSNPLNTGNLEITTKFRAVVKNGLCDAVNSSEATVTVNPTSVGGTATAANSPICSGSSTSITLSGFTGDIQKWQYATNGTWTDINSTSNPLNTGNLVTTTKFRAVVKSGVCAAVNSSEATVVVDAASVGGSVASPQTICSGDQPDDDLVLSGHVGSVVKWQKSTDNFVNNSSDIANTSATLSKSTIGALSGDTWFRAVVDNGVCSEVFSSAVKITVGANPSLPDFTITQPGLCGPETGTLTICESVSGFNYTVGAVTKAGTGASLSFTGLLAGSNPSLSIENSVGGCTSASFSCTDAIPSCTSSASRVFQQQQQEPDGTVEQVTIVTKEEPVVKSQAVNASEPLVKGIKVTAYPNPYNDKVRFVINTEQAGEANLELVNILGQKIATVYNGHLMAGSRSFEVTLPMQHRSTVIYILRLNGNQVTGKLLQSGY